MDIAAHLAPVAARLDLEFLKMHPSIQLASGNYFNFLEPQTTPLLIEDIANGLSRICRFTGHLRDFEIDLYSVAQHCVLASEYGDPAGRPLEYLLHDAPEAVIGDVSSPLKQLLGHYKTIEENVEPAIAKQFGVPYPMTPECKAIDLRMLCTEKRDLMPRDKDGDFWSMCDCVEPLPFTVVPWSRKESYHRFLHRYYYLTEDRFPTPADEYGIPHQHAPADYKTAWREHWDNPDNMAAAGLRWVEVGSRLPHLVAAPYDKALTIAHLAGIDPINA